MEIVELGISQAGNGSQLRYKVGDRLLTFYDNGTVACTCGSSMNKKEIEEKGCKEMKAIKQKIVEDRKKNIL